jgi:ATP-dependent Lon protease
LRALERQQVLRYTDESDHFTAEATALAGTITDAPLAELFTRDIIAELEKSEINEAEASDIIEKITQIDDYGLIADTVAAAVAMKANDKQQLLKITSVTDRLAYLLVFI